ncbi:MAG: hypothetical protein IKQ18_01740 [Clostridia bacterium]|nr:hypothetical protein [Clostridia bacterium]
MRRADGRTIKINDPMYSVISYIMDKRVDSMNMTTVDIPLDPLTAYIHKMRKEKGMVFSYMGIFLAAYLRTACEYPALNRFVINKRVYARNEFCVGLVVLKTDTDHGIMSKIYFDMTDTIFEVQKKIDEYIAENRTSETDNKTEKMLNVLLNVPGLPNFAVGLFKFMDKHNLLPKSVIDASPFHESLLLSNLASIRTNHIYHHVYEFGTTSISVTMGNPRIVPKLKRDEVVFEHTLPLGVVMDERICPGSYFAAVFKRLTQYLKNPALLEVPPEKVEHDPT